MNSIMRIKICNCPSQVESLTHCVSIYHEKIQIKGKIYPFSSWDQLWDDDSPKDNTDIIQ